MSLFYITGIAGSGKSTTWRELKLQGYTAYDVDEDGLAKWQNKKTGYIHPKSSVKLSQRTPDFLASHVWMIPRETVEELAAKARHKDIFLCGIVDNEADIKNFFKIIFALKIDDETLKHRLRSRSGNDWGAQAHELTQTLAWHHEADEQYEKLGYNIINGTKPTKDIVDNIKLAVKSKSDAL